MALRCLLFSADEGTANPILQVLAALGVEGEHCSDAVATVDKVSQQNYQIVILDWDQQPEASLLLTAARERKAAERPLTLAIVSNDLSVPQALQAGANSILRKPIMVNQVKDTLTTARDLLRSKQESASNAAQAAAAGASAGASVYSGTTSLPSSMTPPKERTLRAGEFLQSAGTAPGGEFVTGSEVHESLAPPPAEPVDPLSDLEPMAASMSSATPMTASVTLEKPAPVEKPAPLPPPVPGEVRGLEWFKARAAAAAAPSPAPAPAPAASAKPELLGYDEPAPYSPPPPKSSNDPVREAAPKEKISAHSAEEPSHEPTPEQKREQKKEAQLFAHIAGESSESEEPARPRSKFMWPIIGALVLASLAIAAAPQAPWHPKIGAAWARGRQSVHAWLNPQLVTTPQAPVAHEDFGRAGDEYKLPVAENIPDATTDPSQIRVVPVIDPTVKKSNPEGGNALQPPADDGTGATPTDQTPASGAPAGTSPGAPVPNNAVPATIPVTSPPATGPATVAISASPGSSAGSSAGPSAAASSPESSSGSSAGSSAVAVPIVAPPAHSDPRPSPPAAVSPSTSPASSAATQSAPPKNSPPHYATPPGNVPSSLKSQMASMTPDASGNKAPESAMQSIEPVSVPELTERTFLTDQPALDYPAAARGQSGTVILQVLIGRDGTVQDAKFLQGSLAFAKSAIDGVKLWKFKPYVMNGRPVSVQTSLTISFKP
jgi:protein TonB